MPALFPSSLNHLLVSASASVLLMAAILAAPGQAAETIIGNGSTVTQQIVQPGDTLTVQAGGKIDDAASYAVLDNIAGTITINNQGQIQATTQTAIYAINSLIVVDNSGTILGQVMGIKGDSGITSINNASTGTVGGGTSIGVFGAGIGTIDNAGTIQGITAVQSNSNLGTLNNSGNLQGGSGYGVRSPNIIALTNTTGATITGDTGVYTAVQMGTLVNAGTIEGVKDGIVSDGTIGTLNNSGMIKGDTGKAVSATTITTLTNAASGQIDGATEGVISQNIGTLANDGTIKGGVEGVNSVGGTIGTLTNTGLIQGGSYGVTASTLTTVVNEATGTITSGGAGLQGGTLGSLTNKAGGKISGGGSGLAILTDTGSIINSGSIVGLTLNAVNVGGTISALTNTSSGVIDGAADGVEAVNIGSLTNDGTIKGVNHGVFSNGGTLGTLNNSGLIQAGPGGTGIVGTTMTTVVNEATGVITGGLGLQAGNLGTLTNKAGGTISGARGLEILTQADTIINAGTITGTSTGIDGSAALIKSLVNSGSIVGTGSRGLLVDTIQSMNNSGTISGLDGMRVTTLGTLTNTSTGKITGSGYGIDVVTADSIDNAGTISAGKGMNVVGTLASLVNSGSISGSLQSGMEVGGTIGAASNSGTITGAQWGILSGAINSLNNTGEIIGATMDGINSSGTIGSVTNSGKIVGSSSGIKSSGLLALTNSGTIAGAKPSDFAIVETNPALATNTVLTLNAGSILIGHVDIHGGTNTLNVGPGINLALTFDNSVPEVINAGSAVLAVVGNTVYVADPSKVARAGDTTANLTGGITSLVNGALDKGFDEKGVDGSGHYWLEALGGVGSQPGINGNPALRDGFAGFAVGADFGPDADTRFGGFAGAAHSLVDNGTRTSNSDNLYAGIYAGGQFEDFSVKGSLTAGTSHSTGGTRVVANNTVATGLETVNGSNDAYFVSPSLVLTKPWVTSDTSFETSLALNYTGVFAGAYSEGSPNGLNLDAATTHVFTATGLVTLPMQQQNENGLMTGDLHAGLEGRAMLKPDLNGTLAGTSFNLASASVTATAGVVAGGAMALQFDNGVTLFSGLDTALRTDASLSAVAKLGLKGDF